VKPVLGPAKPDPGDDKIISMYARGMSTREIGGHLRELCGMDVSPDLVSTVTNAVLDEVAAWQQRPLDPAYPLVFFDALRVKIRDEGIVRNKAIHIALGVRADARKQADKPQRGGIFKRPAIGIADQILLIIELAVQRLSVGGGCGRYGHCPSAPVRRFKAHPAMEHGSRHVADG
jgi:Transposase, Mutator family